MTKQATTQTEEKEQEKNCVEELSNVELKSKYQEVRDEIKELEEVKEDCKQEILQRADENRIEVEITQYYQLQGHVKNIVEDLSNLELESHQAIGFISHVGVKKDQLKMLAKPERYIGERKLVRYPRL